MSCVGIHTTQVDHCIEMLCISLWERSIQANSQVFGHEETSFYQGVKIGSHERHLRYLHAATSTLPSTEIQNRCLEEHKQHNSETTKCTETSDLTLDK